MKVDTVIQKAFLAANRKAVPPPIGSTKYEVLLNIIDTKQKDWSAEPSVEWDSLRENRVIGTASSSLSYDLPDDIDYLSKEEDDPILVGTTPFIIVRPNQLYKYRTSKVCAQLGRSIVFPTGVLTNYLGSDITIPGIIKVPDITKGTNTVTVDDPMWLVYASAAEFVRSDVVKSNQYDPLLAQAERHMERMKETNAGAIEEVDTPWTPEGANW